MPAYNPTNPWDSAAPLPMIAVWQLTRGTAGTWNFTGPAPVGTLDEAFAGSGRYAGTPAWMQPTLPAQATAVNSDGFATDGGYTAGAPSLETEAQTPAPYVYIWCDGPGALEVLNDSQVGQFAQPMTVLVRQWRDDGGVGTAVAREYARVRAMLLCQAVVELLERYFPQACRNRAAYDGLTDDTYGVMYATVGEQPQVTQNYQAEADTFVDVFATITIMQARTVPANTGA